MNKPEYLDELILALTRHLEEQRASILANIEEIPEYFNAVPVMKKRKEQEVMAQYVKELISYFLFYYEPGLNVSDLYKRFEQERAERAAG